MAKPTRNENRVANKGATVRSSPAAIERRQRDLRVVEHRKSGATWQAIADAEGLSGPGHAYQRFHAVMKDYPREDVETWRNIISDRYDAALAGLWPDVVKGKWLAIDRATRILEAQAKLHGANRAEKIEVSAGVSELDAALRDLESELRARAQGQPVPHE